MKLSELAATKWSGNDVRIATAVALAESRGKMDAINKNTDGSTDCGPWQVNSVHGYDCNRLRSDPAYTVAAAHAVWQKQGWPAWVTYKTGAYKLYLGRDAELTADDPSILERIGIAALGPVAGSIVSGDNPVTAVVDATDKAAGVILSLTNPSTWLRIGKGWMGGVLIIVGVGAATFIVANRSGVVKTVAKATPAGAVIK